MARIVLTTFGSYGDLFPYLSIGQRLGERGHQAVIAAPQTYRSAVERAKLEFVPVRPDVDYEDSDTFGRVMEPRRGAEVIVREVLVPHLRESFQDLETACDGADLLVSHVLTYAAPILGEKAGIPWVSTVLSPMCFCSACDPPALAPIPWLARLRPLGPGVVGVLLRLLKRLAWSWSEPIRKFRQELGLRANADPLWEGQFSPHGVLALFSPEFAQPQPDWPWPTTICGFPFYDGDFGGNDDSSQLNGFLSEGSPPLVFSLGSSAVRTADDFYYSAAKAAKRLSQRAVMVIGDSASPKDLPDGVIVIRSTTVHSLFKAASIVVHAGGIGTTGQAIRAGRPQLAIPFAADQFDNALRVKRLGIGQDLSRKRLTPKRLTQKLGQLLANQGIRASAAAMAGRIHAEDGTEATCDALERVLLQNDQPARRVNAGPSRS